MQNFLKHDIVHFHQAVAKTKLANTLANALNVANISFIFQQALPSLTMSKTYSVYTLHRYSSWNQLC